MSVAFQNNIVNFNAITGGFVKASVAELGTSHIPGSTGPLNGAGPQLRLFRADGSYRVF